MGAGQRFHKLCLKCSKNVIEELNRSFLFLASCKTILNPGSLNERDKKIYCVPCYRRYFAPRAGLFVFLNL